MKALFSFCVSLAKNMSGPECFSYRHYQFTNVLRKALKISEMFILDKKTVFLCVNHLEIFFFSTFSYRKERRTRCIPKKNIISER